MSGLLRAEDSSLPNTVASGANTPSATTASSSGVADVAATGHDLDRHNDYVKRAQNGKLNIVFLGDSGIVSWPITGRDIWDKNIAPLDAAAFGIGGNTSPQLLWRLRNGELDGYQAKVVLLNIGGNDLKHGTGADTIVPAITACVAEVRKRQPQAQILLMLPPNVYVPMLVPQSYVEHVTATDLALTKLDDGKWIHVLDISDGLNQHKMEIIGQIAMTGDAHKSHLWFEIWWNVIKAPLTKILIPSTTPAR